MTPAELERVLDEGVCVLGCDLATNSGLALYDVTPGDLAPLLLPAARGGRPFGVCLRGTWTCRTGGEWTVACQVIDAVGTLGRLPPLLVAWEDQYLGKNPRSMAVVVAARARMLFALELRARQRGVRLHDVAVNTMSWQAKVLGKARGKARATIKATSDEVAPMIAARCGSALRPRGDAADATCIGLHEIARHYSIDLAAIRGESVVPEKRRRRR